MKGLTYFNIIVAMLVCLAGCNNRIGERKLVKILAEMHLVDALASESGNTIQDSAAIYAPIFAKYNASPAQLYPSLLPYTGNKDKMAALYEKVIRRLEKQQKQYEPPQEAQHEQPLQTDNQSK